SSNITDASSISSDLQIIESIDFANDLLEVVPYESFNTEDNNQKNKNNNSDQDKDSDQNEDSNQEDKDSDNFKALLYGLNKIYEITSKIFEDAKESNELVKFIFEVELDEDLINTVALTQQDLVNINDLKIVKERFNQLAKILAIPLDSGSGYYWEIRKTWLKNDRAWKRPNNQLPKWHRNHNIVHENPTYHRVKFPVNAKEWIQNNILLYNLLSTEVYHRLCTDKLINPEIHITEQVYYWVSALNRETYIKNQENSFLSAKIYLEQLNLNNKEFKVLNYLENDFIRALGFLTPLFKLVGINEATEIIVNFIFKTNQERFELFVININCGGYGMPIAYLYLITLDGSEETRHDSRNFINT
ncbi:7242_t:CDS:2, partial [Cetraspora pellucida]